MALSSKTIEILKALKPAREKRGISAETLDERLNIGRGWVEAVESGAAFPSFDLILSLSQAAGIELGEIIKDSRKEISGRLSRTINGEQEDDDLLLRFQYNDYLENYRLPSATVAQFGELVSEFRKSRNNPKITKNDAVVRTFFKAIDLWPHINPSDIWWFIISRMYLDPYNHPATEINRDLSQSWKRTSGWALEIIIVNHYKDFLGRYGITIGIYPKTRKQQLFGWALEIIFLLYFSVHLTVLLVLSSATKTTMLR